MSFTDVMYGPLGQVNNNFQANLAGNAAAMQSQQGYYGQQAALDAQNQAALANAYGPLGFGGATAANAYAGAAAGRDTGGFGGYGSANADPFTPVSSYNDAAGMSGQGATGTNWNGFIPSPSGDGGTWGPVSNGDPPASPQLGGGVPNAAYPGSSGNNALANALWQGASPQAPALQQPQPQAVDWNSWFTGLASQPANAGGGAGGYWQGNASGDGSTWVPAGGATPTSGGAFNGGSIYGGQPFPSIQNVLGYTPDQFLGAGSGGGGQPQQMGSLFNQGGASWIAPAAPRTLTIRSARSTPASSAGRTPSWAIRPRPATQGKGASEATRAMTPMAGRWRNPVPTPSHPMSPTAPVQTLATIRGCQITLPILACKPATWILRQVR